MPRSPTAARLTVVLPHARCLLEPLEPLLELAPAAAAVRQRRVRLPPVDAHLAGLVHRGDEQPQLDVEELDVEQVDRDVARDHDALVEHPLEDVGEVLPALHGRTAVALLWPVPVVSAHAEPSARLR